MRLVGIIDAHAFRSRILQRREVAKRALSAGSGALERPSAGDEHVELLRAIRSRLDEIATMMRKPE
jgi:hypothetical protein